MMHYLSDSFCLMYIHVYVWNEHYLSFSFRVYPESTLAVNSSVREANVPETDF